MDRSEASRTGLREVGHAVVINLDRRKDRLEAFHQRARLAGLEEVERVAAVDGRQLQPSPEIHHLFRDNDFQNRRAVMGCALSHYRLWQRIADPAWPHRLAAVFEDDVIFCKDFSRLWNQEMAPWVPLESDFVLLGGLAVAPQVARQLIAIGYPFGPEKYPYVTARSNQHFGRPRGPFFTLCSYLIAPAAARTLCRIIEHEGIRHPIDVLIAKSWRCLKVFVSIPLLCWTDSADSDIDQVSDRI